MPFQHDYFDKLTPEDQEKALADIDRVMHAVAALGPDADPAEVKTLFAMLAPESPTELEYIPIEEAA
ncbi:MAG: hypothetical protein PSX80_02640 [bacterium]|nr:hypothetical protein [bacterium]